MKLLQIILVFLCLPILAQAKGFKSVKVKPTEHSAATGHRDTKATALTFTTHEKVNAVYVYDSKGKLVRSANSNDGNVQLDVRSLANGTYYMHVLSDGEKRIEEFVKG